MALPWMVRRISCCGRSSASLQPWASLCQRCAMVLFPSPGQHTTASPLWLARRYKDSSLPWRLHISAHGPDSQCMFLREADVQVTCFSDSEEKAVGKDHVVPFMPESRLRELGGLYEKVRGHPLLMPPGGLQQLRAFANGIGWHPDRSYSRWHAQGPDWSSFVVEDLAGPVKLITGQNPQASRHPRLCSMLAVCSA